MVSAADSPFLEYVSATRVTRISDWILIVAFCTAITVPGVIAFRNAGEDVVDVIEKRKLASAPEWTRNRISDVPAQIDAYFNDRLGFRRTYIGWHNWYLWQSGISSSPSQVLLGRENWLYFIGFADMHDFLGNRPMPPATLDRWRKSLESRQKWLAERKIKYLFFVAPNKQTIHPEFLPGDLQQRHSSHTNFDQLAGAIPENLKANFLDLRNPLREAAKRDIVYYPQDTHWNAVGQRVAYREILQRCRHWFSEEQIGPELQFSEHTVAGPLGVDLRKMLGLPESMPELLEHMPGFLKLETEYPLLLPENVDAPNYVSDRSQKTPWPEDSNNDTYENERGRLRILLFGDSFLWGGDLKVWIANHFRRTCVIYNPQDFESFQRIVEQERPDLVVEECVERFVFFATSR